jgi:hypothetical protein
MAPAGRVGDGWNEEEKTLMTQASLKTPVEYIIVAVPFHADAATHDELARKVNEKLNAGYELLGPPLLSEEMMYQPMTKSFQPVSPSPIP